MMRAEPGIRGPGAALTKSTILGEWHVMAAPHSSIPGVRFKDIPGFVGYAAADNGTIWSRWAPGHAGHIGRWKLMRGHKRPDGYVHVYLKRGNRTIDCRVHRLVLESFVGPCPDGMEARHVNDNDRSNNRLENLCWGTPKQNTDDRRRHGTIAKGERNGSAKLTKANIAEMYDMFEAGSLVREIAERFCVDPSMTSKILRGRYWADAVPGRIPPLVGDARQRGAITREQRKIHDY